MATHSRIVQLAKLIAADTKKVDSFLQEKGIPSPSFHETAPSDMVLESEEAEHYRISAIDATMDLQDLLIAPKACLRPTANATALEAIYRWNIPRHVPLEKDISFRDLAEKTGSWENDLKRIIRFASVHHRCFREPREGYVTHSAASKLMLEDPDVHDTVGMMFDESWQAFARTCDALARFEGEEPHQTAYSLAHELDTSVWQHYKNHPERGRRFARAMNSLASHPGNAVSFLVSSYPWSALGDHATVVDVGGSQGHVSLAISREHPNFHFVVQDLSGAFEGAQILTEMENRVELMEHDFLTTQPVQADAYLFRWIFHDWPDSYVVKILQNLRPALKPGSEVIVNDSIMPKPGASPLMVEKQLRALDSCMLSFFNAREREEEDWKLVFAVADSRFSNIKTWTQGATLSIIEATWTD